jgi:hypothetical protein
VVYLQSGNLACAALNILQDDAIYRRQKLIDD